MNDINSEQELRSLEQSLWVADTRFDVGYMESVLADDFFEFGRSGKRYTRAQCLSAKSEPINCKLPLDNFAVHTLKDDFVLVAYISEVQYEDLEKANRSSIWSKTNGQWKLHFHQGTPLPL